MLRFLSSSSSSPMIADVSRHLAITTTDVKSRVLPFVLEGGLEFDRATSYQSVALQSVANQFADATELSQTSDAQLVQLYVLYCIFEATNGKPNVMTSADLRFAGLNETTFPKWYNTLGWNSPYPRKPCGNASAAIAPWYGITCNDQDQITEIELAANMLTGSWPPEIKLLAGDGPYSTSGAGSLINLDLYDNEFLFNNFDTSWMTDLGSQLEFFYVGATGFVGRFPEFPVGVIEVDFGYTMVHRDFDDSVFANSPLIEYLNLGGNALNTTLPWELIQLPNLQFLYIHECMLLGDLGFLPFMPSIVELWIDKNPYFSGGIPLAIGSVTTLESLSLTDNGLDGTLPTQLGQLTNLQQLWLYGNDLFGSIPSEMGNLVLLKTLEIGGNARLVGSMPSTVCSNTGYFGRLQTVGADCNITTCLCCTCCSLTECQPDLYPNTPPPLFTTMP